MDYQHELNKELRQQKESMYYFVIVQPTNYYKENTDGM
jgi:hypothetical protein